LSEVEGILTIMFLASSKSELLIIKAKVSLLIFIFCFIFLCMRDVRADPLDLSKERMTSENYNPATLVVTANKLISLGQTKAEDALTTLANTKAGSGLDEMDRDSYIAWLCLLIYDPKEGEGLPTPGFGGPDFPNTGFVSKPKWTVFNSSKWPRFPLTMKRQVPFLLVQGYELAGLPEPISLYLEDCRKNEVFRTDQYTVPTYTLANEALKELLTSPEWHALNWKQLGGEGSLWRNRKIDFLKNQVQRIKSP
jgi:hypothetical protein